MGTAKNQDDNPVSDNGRNVFDENEKTEVPGNEHQKNKGEENKAVARELNKLKNVEVENFLEVIAYNKVTTKKLQENVVKHTTNED